MSTHKIVVLKCKPQSLTSVEQYLANRDWQVYATPTLKSAISSIIKISPDFVFVAVDHPNKKVRVLPKLLGQALKVKVVGFIEAATPQAMQTLNDLKLDYVLFPPLSGPSIERLISRMKKDELRQAEQAERDATREAINGPTPTEGTGNDAVIVSKGDKKNGKGVFHITGEKNKDAMSAVEQGIQARQLLEQLLSEEPKSENDLKEPTLVAKSHSQESPPLNPEADPYAAEWSSKKDKPLGYSDDEAPSSQGDDFSDLSKSDSNRLSDSTPPSQSDDPKKISIKTHTPSPALKESDSILVRGAHEALDESVFKIENLEEFEAITAASRVACIIVDSPRFSGYLVAAMGEDRSIDDSFVGSIKTRLVDFLRKHGEVIKDDEAGMDLKIEQVEFEDWAINQAEFLRKSIHGSSEVAMAFFPNPETQVRLEQSANENMLQMDIKELQDDIPVEFDMYIYMPTNNKYLLYTPQGRKLAGQQRGRLMDKGVQKIHLRKESEHQVKKYRAQIFLNSKIQAYKTGSKNKKTGS